MKMDDNDVQVDCSESSDVTNGPNNVDALNLDKANLDAIRNDSIEDGEFSFVANGPNNVDSSNLDKADLDAMKGDSIGDTVYSEKWILKTLVALSKVLEDGWSESLESDLCTLWDMTAEKDVVSFLKDIGFLRIAEFVLRTSKEPRLTEIILGIIGNMCCQPSVLETLANSENLLSRILGLLCTDDTETLLQILRLLQIVVWDIQKNPETKWLGHLRDCQILGDVLCFILQSSTNDDLLIATVDLLNAFSTIKTADKGCLLMELVKVNQLVAALIESFVQFVPKKDMTHTRVDLEFIQNWLSIFPSMIESQLGIFSSELDDDQIGHTELVMKLEQVLLKILEPYVNSSNLLPLEERLAVCIHDCVVMSSWICRHKNRKDLKITRVVVTIMHQLRCNIKENAETEGFMDMEETKDLAKHLEKYWLETLQAYEENEILEIIQSCHNPVIECLMDVAEEYANESPDAVAKLLRVQSLCNGR